MSTRRAFLSFLALGLLSARRGKAEQGKVFRVGDINHSMPKIYGEIFSARMQGLGYVDGQNVLYENRHGAPQEFPAFALDLVRKNVDAPR